VTKLLSGVCFREGDVLVFATKAAPAPQWKMQITNTLKARKCQGVSKIELRQLGPGEPDEAAPEEGAAGDGASATKPPGGSKPPVAKKPKGLSAEWDSARNAAVKGVGDLIGKLKATGNAGAVKASEVVQALADAFPTGLDAALASLEKASASNDPKALATARAQAKAQTDVCLAFLSTNQKIIGLCEGNPFGATVAISQPLTGALQAIAARIG